MSFKPKPIVEGRIFEGSGSWYLAVPGLLELHSVSQSDRHLNQWAEEVLNIEGKPTLSKVPVFAMEQHPSLGTILRRHSSQLFGNYPRNEKFIVHGVWE